ncbi:hypothetical protein GJW-30_1_00863 [Variibacter gotjawalensis]|uniref:Inositolphosphotransferase Aur1/Ipt1 domain-containing protein n=1 Tax=Variibacter gotjawalensis TaxID=1333996 RepID=A0A0S3PR18_9BRAD|nr:phosphatase PAP2 family protein [Variibacter gotjawalensis]NIK48641.1 hypothetical protein [Variibacter gotjawalensis]RZS50505.1 PAP2 superfamily protein [Variibacter gotjawalensis]BAT58339.1 hypothetical protein GJW-30_1_00863 [Variibacter gotjawalensis]
MSNDWTRLRVLDTLAWAIVGLVALCILAAVAGPFRAEWKGFLPPVVTGVILSLGAAYYSRREEHGISSALSGTALMVCFSAVAIPLSYVVASFGGAAHDQALVSADRALGFDWRATYTWIAARPVLQLALELGYSSLIPQTIVCVLILAFTGHLVRLRIFILAFMISGVATIAISGLFPAEGIWHAYGIYSAGPNGAMPTLADLPNDFRVLYELRHGLLRTLAASNGEGIISFPSYHTCLGVLFATALWPVRYVRWIGVVINGLLIASVPVIGNHYFVDVPAGIAVAAATWFAVSVVVTRVLRSGETAMLVPKSI